MFYFRCFAALVCACGLVFWLINACFGTGAGILAVIVIFILSALEILSMPNPDDPYYKDHPSKYKEDVEYHEYSNRWRLY